MDWQKRMNQAMEYIENHLTDTIDYAQVAQFLNCSQWEFRRIFSFITNIPLSEYIRRRKLTMAAGDIQRGDKIVDVSLHYGYESQASFSRAFRKMHGMPPCAARSKGAALKPFQRLNFKLILMEGVEMNKNYRPNIIGAGEVGVALSLDMDRDAIHQTNSLFWGTKGNKVLGTTAMPNYGAYICEEEHHLFGDVSGKKILEIGCGAGHSLQYLGERNAGELWGLDISPEQIEMTRKRLEACGVAAKLICAPMEADCGVKGDHFDIVYSVYGIGWTTDLDGTFERIASYLKKGGVFIFSWSHPIHKCVASQHDMLVFKKCYFDESWYSVSIDGGSLSLCDRQLSTYINALAKAGFVIEQMVEQSSQDMLQHDKSDFAKKAAMLPVSFVIKARKL